VAATDDARDATLALLDVRAPEATICPSEVARALLVASGVAAVAADWRDAMPAVHVAIDQLLAEGAIRLSWKGKALESRAGPYRIGRGGSANQI
jgi:hypothetical protein